MLRTGTPWHDLPSRYPSYQTCHRRFPHVLGGYNMRTSTDTGVVNHAGEAFGYKNLFVADGAIVPRALGVNPSRTIGALAERISEGMNKGGS